MPNCTITVTNKLPPSQNVLVKTIEVTFSYRNHQGKPVKSQTMRKSTTLASDQLDFVTSPSAKYCVFRTSTRLFVTLPNGMTGVTKRFDLTSPGCEGIVNLRLTQSGIQGAAAEEQFELEQIPQGESSVNGTVRPLQFVTTARRIYSDVEDLELALGFTGSTGLRRYLIGNLKNGDDIMTNFDVQDADISAAFILWKDRGRRRAADVQSSISRPAMIYCHHRGISIDGLGYDYQWVGSREAPIRSNELDDLEHEVLIATCSEQSGM